MLLSSLTSFGLLLAVAAATPLGFLQKEHRTDDEGGLILPADDGSQGKAEGVDYRYADRPAFPVGSSFLKPGVLPEDSFVLHRQNVDDQTYHFAYVAPGQAHQQQRQAGVVTGSYSLSNPSGEDITVQYVADASGFHVLPHTGSPAAKSAAPPRAPSPAEQPASPSSGDEDGSVEVKEAVFKASGREPESRPGEKKADFATEGVPSTFIPLQQPQAVAPYSFYRAPFYPFVVAPGAANVQQAYQVYKFPHQQYVLPPHGLQGLPGVGLGTSPLAQYIVAGYAFGLPPKQPEEQEYHVVPIQSAGDGPSKNQESGESDSSSSEEEKSQLKKAATSSENEGERSDEVFGYSRPAQTPIRPLDDFNRKDVESGSSSSSSQESKSSSEDTSTEGTDQTNQPWGALAVAQQVAEEINGNRADVSPTLDSVVVVNRNPDEKPVRQEVIPELEFGGGPPPPGFPHGPPPPPPPPPGGFPGGPPPFPGIGGGPGGPPHPGHFPFPQFPGAGNPFGGPFPGPGQYPGPGQFPGGPGQFPGGPGQFPGGPGLPPPGFNPHGPYPGPHHQGFPFPQHLNQVQKQDAEGQQGNPLGSSISPNLITVLPVKGDGQQQPSTGVINPFYLQHVQNANKRTEYSVTPVRGNYVPVSAYAGAVNQHPVSAVHDAQVSPLQIAKKDNLNRNSNFDLSPTEVFVAPAAYYEDASKFPYYFTEVGQQKLLHN